MQRFFIPFISLSPNFSAHTIESKDVYATYIARIFQNSKEGSPSKYPWILPIEKELLT